MRRKFYVLVLVLAVFAMVQRPAYAMTATIPWGDASGDFAYYAGKHKDAYSAAAELAGYDLSALTQEQRTALLDVNGDYVAYGQLAERLTTLAQVADDFGGAVSSFFNVNGWLEIMGLDEIWVYRAHNNDLIQQAALDIQECIAEHPRATGNPDVGGSGGGGSPSEGEYYEFKGYVHYRNYSGTGYSRNYLLEGTTKWGWNIYNTTWTIFQNPITVRIKKDIIPGDISTAVGFIRVNNGNISYIGIYDGGTPVYNINTVYNDTQYIEKYSYPNTYEYVLSQSIDSYTVINNTITIDYTGTMAKQNVNSDTNDVSTTSEIGLVLDGSSSTPPYTPTLPQYPDNDIPDPTNISLPDIIMPNITLPNIYPPSTQPSNPTYNTYTYNTYNTATGTDVIPYLLNIIEWLSEIDLDIVSGLNALGSIMDGVNTQIRQQIKWLFDSLDVELDAGVMAINETIGSYVDALAGLINDAFEDSFYDLKVWLKDALTKIKNEISDFDDDMMYELKLIRRKMGGGRSSEPSAKDNPDDWLKWWRDLIADLLGKLAEALPDELLELVEDFKALASKFPFSIPWDIAFLVGLFAHAPVTPVFDYPVPYGYANGELLVASVHVDLSPWDGVALAIRNTQLVGFAIWLAFNTSKLSTYLHLPGTKSKGE